MKKTILALSLLSLNAHSIELDQLDFSLETGIFTTHLSTQNFVENNEIHAINNNNNLIGFSVARGDLSLELSTFENSYYKRSYTVGIAYDLFSSEYLDLSVSGGIVKGYQEWMIPTNFYKDYSVFVAPTATIKYNSVFTSVRLLGEAINVSVGFKF